MRTTGLDGGTQRRDASTPFTTNNGAALPDAVIVLSGAGRHFCAGADINMMRDAGANTPEENRADSKRLDRLFNGLWAHPCFTVGAIQGVALGGGAGLGGMPWTTSLGPRTSNSPFRRGNLGILPAVIGPYVYRRLGSACFRRLAMQASRS